MQNQAQAGATGQGILGRAAPDPAGGQVVLCLLSMNGTFDRKAIVVPFYPDTLRIGRQTNQKTVPTPTNGYFDSKVLSRQHAEIWADRSTGKIYIRDVKSSNGTFVNGARLSQENRESDPHELNAGDHLELGIDIVNEDQKTVVHHKVAAKVEHAGFATPSSLPEMFTGPDDPNNAMMQNQGAMQMRGRSGSNSSMASNGRMAPATAAGLIGAQTNGMGPSRPLWIAQITTDQIVKRLTMEMRNARMQAQDLTRTSQFVNTLLSKEDVKDMEKSEAAEQPKPHTNGNMPSFRVDSKTRFSDPPAPPPQAPLPEKPDVARNGEPPALKRGTTERPKAHSMTGPPARQENLTQIIQLTEELKNAKKKMDSQDARMREMEEMLRRERSARENAEELARRLEDATKSQEVPETPRTTELDQAFEPPAEVPTGPDSESISEKQIEEEKAAQLQARLDAMMAEMIGLKNQLEEYRQRAEKAEEERDADRKSLADMVRQIRQEEDARRLAEEEVKSLRALRGRRPSKPLPMNGVTEPTPDPTPDCSEADIEESKERGVSEGGPEPASLSSALMEKHMMPAGRLANKSVVTQSLPYTSMLSVVLIGMGIMAYMNGWQPQPRLQR